MSDLFEKGLSGGTPTGVSDGEDGAGEASSPFRGERADEVRRRIGRPKGARNKRDLDAERWYFAKGYTDPMQRLGELVTEDPRVLQAWFDEHAGYDREGNKLPGPSILDVVRMQIAAAGELMPYLHGKKPIDVNVSDERLPTLIIAAGLNQLDQARLLDQARTIDGRKALSVGAPEPEPEPNEIKDVEAGE